MNRAAEATARDGKFHFYINEYLDFSGVNEMKTSTLKAVGALLLLVSAAAASQTPVLPYQEYEKRIKSAGTMAPLGDELFGEKVSLYNGATEFVNVDIDLKGNNALRVALGRRFKIESKNEVVDLGGFGLWDLDVPHIHGTYIDNWIPSAGRRRCNDYAAPIGDGIFEARDFWSGAKVYIPGRGDQEILRISNGSLFPKMTVPNDGYSYLLGTQSFDRIRCKDATANGYPGEAFIVKDTQGTTYTFDVAFARSRGIMERFQGIDGNARITRQEIYLAVSKVQDRFGNVVDYTWSGDKLMSINASDGRRIDLTWSGSNIVTATVADDGRSWNYAYGGPAGSLTVTLPDGSYWQYATPSPLPNYPVTDAETDGPACMEAFEGYGPAQLTARHPSGATGTFYFELTRHRRSGIPASSCQFIFRPFNSDRAIYGLAIPDYFDVYSIKSKVISGPGVSEKAWSYSYDYVIGRSGYESSEANPCLVCQQNKQVLVIDPDGSKTEYVFGTLWNYNDGRLLATYRRRADDVIVRADLNTYMSADAVPNMPFPEVYGYSSSTDDAMSVKIRPVVQTRILVDGDIPGPVYYTPPPPPPPPPPCEVDCGPPPLPPELPPPCEPFCQVPTVIAQNPSKGPSRAGASSLQGFPPIAFTRRMLEFDAFARPVKEVKESSVGP